MFLLLQKLPFSKIRGGFSSSEALPRQRLRRKNRSPVHSILPKICVLFTPAPLKPNNTFPGGLVQSAHKAPPKKGLHQNPWANYVRLQNRRDLSLLCPCPLPQAGIAGRTSRKIICRPNALQYQKPPRGRLWRIYLPCLSFVSFSFPVTAFFGGSAGTHGHAGEHSSPLWLAGRRTKGGRAATGCSKRAFRQKTPDSLLTA